VTNKALIIAVTRCSKESVDSDMRVILWNLVRSIPSWLRAPAVDPRAHSPAFHYSFGASRVRADEPGAIFLIFFVSL
jgi:hypothetical protein